MAVLARTLRIQVLDRGGLLDAWARGEQTIVAFWHARGLLMPIMAGGRRICIMNSQHRDGELASRALAYWGIQSVRGSATRGGIAGFRRLVAAYGEGYSLAVVPDGPRGPAERVKAGVVRLARVTGAPVYPVAYGARPGLRLRSWDRMLVPVPFGRAVFVVGEPVQVPGRATRQALEDYRATLEARLAEVTRHADDAVRG